jgi:tRNA(fMet)-specific endonuclease VapC
VIHLDTSLLVDLQRELARERPGPAFDFMESLPEDEVLAVSVHAVCELRAGAELVRQPLAAHEAVDRLLAGLLIRYPDDRFAMQFARLAPSFRRGHAPAEKDLLIATAALLDDAPLVTRNVTDFSKVPGLRVLRY